MDGKVSSSLNSTFITLIPKCENPLTLADYWPISSCIHVYKLISKVIASFLKPILDRSNSAEQFGFLKNIQSWNNSHARYGTIEDDQADPKCGEL